MLKIILVVLVVVIAAVLGYASTKPDDFRYESSVVINAPAADILPQINDLRAATAWSAWEKMDPDMTRTYSGADKGVGAVYEWNGDGNAGAGRIEIVESTPSKVVYKLDFIKPFPANNMGEYILEEQDGGTKITSAMYGPQPFIGKVMSVFIDCEKMISEKTMESLTNLKAILEK